MKAFSLTTAALCFLAFSGNAQSPDIDQEQLFIYFEPGKAELTSESLESLTYWINEFGLRKVNQIRITGHTDSDGSDEYNQTLSADRAFAVQSFFLDRNFDSEDLSISYSGESLPIDNNETDDGKQSNRRVEINADLSPTTYGNTLEDLDVETQVFRFRADEDIVVVGKGGTELFIPAKSLVDAKGRTPRATIKIELKEYLKPSDFLAAGLHTQSGAQLLETGGTIKVEARSGSRKLKLREGEVMDVLFASRTEDDEMQLFNGVDDHGRLDWRASNAQRTMRRGLFTDSRTGTMGLIPFIVQSIDNRLFNLVPDIGISLNAAQRAELQEASRLSKMVMSSGELGWINCDRFYNTPNPTVISAIVDSSYHAQVFLVFQTINSIMMSNGKDVDGQTLHFNNVPKGKKARLVAMAYVNDEPYYAVQDVVIGQDDYVPMNLVATTNAHLKQVVKMLD